MKKIILTLSVIYFSMSVSAQNIFPASGNAGIATTTPGSRLTIKQAGAGVSIEPGGNPYYGTLAFNRESGTGVIFDPTGNAFQINNGGTDKNLHIQVYNGLGQRITNDALVIDGNGNIGVGTPNPPEKFSVDGKIRAREVKVETASWPDYVFSKTYKLPSLQKTEEHIIRNGHLPGIPSAADVKSNGIDLGDMNAKLLQKIEELTLYVIEIKRDTKKLRSKVELQAKKIKIIQSKL